MITKAFILGAGLGSRLKPLTNFYPKPLVPVWNEPLAFHTLRHCKAAGIEQFAINTHYLAHLWDETFPTREFEGAPIDFFHEEILLETGGGIKNIGSFIGDDSILVFNGDIITDIDLQGLMEAHESSNNLATLAVKSSGPCCNIAVENSQVTDLRHDLGIHPGNHQFTGIYCLSAKVLDLIPSNTKISIIPAFLELAKQGLLGSFNVDKASWHDIGTVASYLEVHQSSELRDENGNFIHPTATVSEKATIEDSIIWPNVTISENQNLQGAIAIGEQIVTP